MSRWIVIISFCRRLPRTPPEAPWTGCLLAAHGGKQKPRARVPHVYVPTAFPTFHLLCPRPPFLSPPACPFPDLRSHAYARLIAHQHTNNKNNEINVTHASVLFCSVLSGGGGYTSSTRAAPCAFNSTGRPRTTTAGGTSGGGTWRACWAPRWAPSTRGLPGRGGRRTGLSWCQRSSRSGRAHRSPGCAGSSTR